jgi:hypothetical protein
MSVQVHECFLRGLRQFKLQVSNRLLLLLLACGVGRTAALYLISQMASTSGP